MAYTRLSLRLDDRMRHGLKRESRASGKSEAEIVREALAAHFDTQREGESCLNLARRHRLIGCGKGLPAGLSTNREYFDGNTL